MASAEDVPVDKGVVMVVVPMAVAFWGGPVRVTTAVSDLVSETVRVMADSMDSVVTVWALSLEGTVTVTVTVSASHSELDEVPTVWVKTPLTTRVVLVAVPERASVALEAQVDEEVEQELDDDIGMVMVMLS